MNMAWNRPSGSPATPSSVFAIAFVIAVTTRRPALEDTTCVSD